MRLLSFVLAATSTCIACASSSAQHPSAGGHEQLARENERAAQEHLTSAIGPARRQGDCGGARSVGTCWTANDDAERAEAATHMRDAMRHRASSQALRDAQARACAGVESIDREVSPFAHVKDIVRVEPLTTGPKLVGAKVTFRQVEGLTQASFQRIVDCHVAEADALGHDVPEESFCPLNLPDVKATVTAAPNGYDVAIVTDDAASAKEVLRRAGRRRAEPAGADSDARGRCTSRPRADTTASASTHSRSAAHDLESRRRPGARRADGRRP